MTQDLPIAPGKQKGVLPLKEAYSFGAHHNLNAEISAIREMEIEWERSYDSTVRRGFIVELFERHSLLNEFIANVWPYGASPKGQTLLRRYERIRKQYEDFTVGISADSAGLEEVEVGLLEEDALSFSLESQLQEFIAQNIEAISVNGRRLSVYIDSSGQRGIEYPTEVGRIDILARDKNGAFIVFELKRAKGPDHVIGQLARYMGWVKERIANGAEVHGVIVAKEIGDKLRFALSVLPNVSLFEYEVAFTLRPAGALK